MQMEILFIWASASASCYEPSPDFSQLVLVIWWIVHYSMITKDLASAGNQICNRDFGVRTLKCEIKQLYGSTIRDVSLLNKQISS
jgi:hypothetical protein